MKPLNQTQLLDIRIAALRMQQQSELIELKQQFLQITNSLSPVNLIYKSLNGLYKIPTGKGTVFKTAVSLAGGYLSRKIVVGKSNAVFKKTVGNLLQLTVTNFLLNLKHKSL